MGDDGAVAMEAIQKAGGYTIVQDKDSAVIYGMPEAALSRGIVNKVVNLDEIADFVVKLAYKDTA